MIELHDVEKSFGANHVIRGISASVGKGEVVCIIGPSGSGKSTVLRCINGLETYDRGAIFVDGIKVDSKARSIKAIRTQIAMVFQRFNLFPHRTVLENVIEGPIHVKGERRDVAVERGNPASVSPTKPIPIRRNCQAGRCNGSRLRDRSPWSQKLSSSTNRRPRSTLNL